MNRQMGYAGTELLVVVIALATILGAGGWIANIVKLIGMDFASVTGMMVGRAIGIFVPPLGAVLGFL